MCAIHGKFFLAPVWGRFAVGACGCLQVANVFGGPSENVERLCTYHIRWMDPLGLCTVVQPLGAILGNFAAAFE